MILNKVSPISRKTRVNLAILSVLVLSSRGLRLHASAHPISTRRRAKRHASNIDITRHSYTSSIDKDTSYLFLTCISLIFLINKYKENHYQGLSTFQLINSYLIKCLKWGVISHKAQPAWILIYFKLVREYSYFSNVNVMNVVILA